jgi:pentatricopeptide repeat protein
MQAGAEIFKQILGEGLQPDHVTYNELMQHVRRLNNPDEFEAAMDQYEKMLKRAIHPSGRTFNILLDAATMKNIRALKSRWSRTQSSEDLVAAVLSEMEVTGIKMDIVTYSILIKNFIYNRDINSAEETFRSMLASGIRPNRYVYTQLMDGYGKTCHMEAAERLCQQMVDVGIKKDRKIYTCLIDGYLRNERIEDAYREFRDMRDAREQADVVTYTSFMNRFARIGDVKTVRRIFDFMRSKCIEADLAAYTVVLKAHAVAGDVEGASAVYTEMLQANLKLDGLVLATLTTALGNGRSRRQASTLLRV